MDNSAEKVTQKNHECTILSNLKLVKKNIEEQRKVNKCRTKSGKKLYIALCIVVKYINGKQVIYT